VLGTASARQRDLLWSRTTQHWLTRRGVRQGPACSSWSAGGRCGACRNHGQLPDPRRDTVAGRVPAQGQRV